MLGLMFMREYEDSCSFIVKGRRLTLGFKTHCQLCAVVNFLSSLPLIIDLNLRVVFIRVGEWAHSHVLESGSTYVLRRNFSSC